MALSVEENELITHVGPGTPCGEMMRRYWHPIGLSAELKGRPVRRRLLGEDLVVFRDDQGRLGLLALRCSHRGTSLEFGHIEDNILRLALSRFTVGFGLWHNQRAALDLEPAASEEARTRRVAELLDAAEAGREGPWVTTARMRTLRSPKTLTGPDHGIPSLTYRAWHEAVFGKDDWSRLDKIDRLMHPKRFEQRFLSVL